MKTNEQTIGAKMQQRQNEARAKIQSELWKDTPDTDKIVSLALAGGLPPVEVDQIAASIETAKAQLEDLSGLDLIALKTESERAGAARDKASVTLEKAQSAYDTAEATAGDAGAAFDSAFQKFRAAAGAATAGSLPTDRLPEIVQKIMDYDAAVDHAQQFHSEMAQDRIEKRKLEGQVSALSEASANAKDLKKAGVTAMGLNGKDAGPGVAKRLRDSKAALKAVVAKIGNHPTEQAKRDRAVEAAKTNIWM